jgi:hypothetical protein
MIGTPMAMQPAVELSVTDRISELRRCFTRDGDLDVERGDPPVVTLSGAA